MSARLRLYLLLWRSAMAHAGAYVNLVFGWMLALVAALCVGVGIMLDGERLAIAWCAPFGILLFAWGSGFASGAARLNTPANAKLVPRMRERLAELAFASWFLCLAAIALCPFGDTQTLAYALAWIGTFSLGIGLSAAGHGAGTVLILVAVFMPYTDEVAPWVLAAASSRLFLAAVLVLLGLVGLAAVRAMFPEGGERHWRMKARRDHWTRQQSPGDTASPKDGIPSLARWYPATLRRDCVRRDPRTLMLHVLGPSVHYGTLLVGVAGMLVLGLVVIALARIGFMRDGPGLASGIGWLMASTILFLPMFQAYRPTPLLRATAAEQSLLRLAPSMPATAPALNRQLGRGLLARALAGWALASLAAFSLAWLSGASQAALAWQAVICCLALPMMAVSLRNHARRAPLRGTVLTVLFAGSSVLCLAGGAVAHGVLGLPLMPVAALAALVLAVAAMLRGLRRMEHAPFAFPAGRMD